ncbi:hypothetical protein [Fuerstiella marisgermanici]|uniref:Uncharacterized protein n=1 Tax=Fuerstiella marisgermanici TaxID=1891926 RepID=A0A1P8WPI5_9PLAN|nr:hypothetical protein [Fuerstiella marisgermanici]APZ95970.1 hypothetical protein Fuma_05633 [Fuerstiella marisgermanici]
MFGKSKKSRRQAKHVVTSGCVQSLEERRLMTGDVKVLLSSTDSRDLVINGDNSSNDILIEEVGIDRIRVTGQNGTRINGGMRPVTLTVTDDVNVNMNGGDDSVTIRNLNLDNAYHNDLNINLGSGRDTLNIEATDVARHVNAKGGDGNDYLGFREIHVGDLLVDGEYGDDRFRLNEVVADASVTLDGGEDWDSFEVRDSVVGNDLIVTGDSGDDRVFIDAIDVADDIRVNLGSGDDDVNIYSSDADDISVVGGTGDDSVGLSYNDVVDQLYVSLGAGNDDLYFPSNSVGRHYFDGGTGRDTWYSGIASYFWSWVNFYNFE